MQDDLLRWIRPAIRSLSAYHVADAEGLIKLDAMENPYRLPHDLRQALARELAGVALNRYPDPAASALCAKLKSVMQVPDEAAILPGNGSDELIQLLAMAVAGEGRCLMAFEPGFVMYEMIARFVGIDYVGVPLDDRFQIDLDATLAAIETHRPALIFIAYPNNPTANLFGRDAIEAIIDKAPGLVVLDEAYHPFAQQTFMPRLQAHANLLVMRTVSKLGLAGLRLGYLCGARAIIDELNKLRLPYNINALSQCAARFMLAHSEVLEEQAAEIRAQRGVVLAALQALDGVEAWPSDANFILFRLLQGEADAVFEAIRAEGVLIKNMKAKDGPLANCLRVTIGAPEENRAFLQALEKALNRMDKKG